MRLKNKKTGEIVTLTLIIMGKDMYNHITKLSELKDYEDYEEPKEYWFIDFNGEIKKFKVLGFEWQGRMKEIGNYFSSREEAELAIRKLKALKRLKDKGSRFTGYTDDSEDLFSCQVIRCRFDDFGKESRNDLDLLFGGEE